MLLFCGGFFFDFNYPSRCRGWVIRASFYPSSVSFADTFPPRGRLEGVSFNTTDPSRGRLTRERPPGGRFGDVFIMLYTVGRKVV